MAASRTLAYVLKGIKTPQLENHVTALTHFTAQDIGIRIRQVSDAHASATTASAGVLGGPWTDKIFKEIAFDQSTKLSAKNALIELTIDGPLAPHSLLLHQVMLSEFGTKYAVYVELQPFDEMPTSVSLDQTVPLTVILSQARVIFLEYDITKNSYILSMVRLIDPNLRSYSGVDPVLHAIYDAAVKSNPDLIITEKTLLKKSSLLQILAYTLSLLRDYEKQVNNMPVNAPKIRLSVQEPTPEDFKSDVQTRLLQILHDVAPPLLRTKLFEDLEEEDSPSDSNVIENYTKYLSLFVPSVD
jgi:hypothetical protein